MTFVLNPFEYNYPNNSKKSLFLKEKIEISTNELVAIVGPSGSGKSTFLKILKGIIPEYEPGELTGGPILYNNKELTGENFTYNLNSLLYLFQNPFSQLIYPNVEEEFLFSMENLSYSIEKIEAKTNEIEETFGLNSLWGRRTSHLSHGQCQRLVLASLVAIEPDVILLDEPTAFLDPLGRKDFYSLISKLKENKTIFIVDHHVNEIEKYVDTFLYVDESGEIQKKDSLKACADESIKNKTINLSSVCNVKNNIKFKASVNNFQYENEAILIEDANLSLRNGDCVCIKGSNGEGKSTLLKLISQQIKSKKCLLEMEEGDNVRQKKMYDYIFNVYQSPENHFFFDSIKEEIEDANKIDDQLLARNLISECFSGLNLEMSPFKLSEGEKRRLSIVMAVLSGRKIIFYDEPTFGQDQVSIELISSMINQLKDLGYIQVIISHDEKFINSVANKIYKLENKRLTNASK